MFPLLPQENCHQLESKEASLRNTLKKLESRLTEKDSLSTQMERDGIEDYQRGLELERNHLAQTDDMKAIILSEGKLAQELQDQKFKAELNAHLQTISQLKHDRFVAVRRAKTLETELRQEHDALEASRQKVAELQAKVSKGFREKEAYKEKEQELHTKIKFLQNKLKMTEAKQCGGEQEAIRLREELSAQMLTTAEKKKVISPRESRLKALNGRQRREINRNTTPGEMKTFMEDHNIKQSRVVNETKIPQSSLSLFTNKAKPLKACHQRALNEWFRKATSA
ncbi:Hypp1107 [Branchiostoma lanceolatum]|nr:Hypp1107 [Branchiostoma lanceolatum]